MSWWNKPRPIKDYIYVSRLKAERLSTNLSPKLLNRLKALNVKVGPVGAALAADRHGLGTNAVALRAGIPFTFHFGPASLAAHRAAAPAGARIVTTPGLGLDVDTPEDWTLSECGDPPAAAFLFVTEGQ